LVRLIAPPASSFPTDHDPITSNGSPRPGRVSATAFLNSLPESGPLRLRWDGRPFPGIRALSPLRPAAPCRSWPWLMLQAQPVGHRPALDLLRLWSWRPLRRRPRAVHHPFTTPRFRGLPTARL